MGDVTTFRGRPPPAVARAYQVVRQPKRQRRTGQQHCPAGGLRVPPQSRQQDDNILVANAHLLGTGTRSSGLLRHTTVALVKYSQKKASRYISFALISFLLSLMERSIVRQSTVTTPCTPCLHTWAGIRRGAASKTHPQRPGTGMQAPLPANAPGFRPLQYDLRMASRYRVSILHQALGCHMAIAPLPDPGILGRPKYSPGVWRAAPSGINAGHTTTYRQTTCRGASPRVCGRQRSPPARNRPVLGLLCSPWASCYSMLTVNGLLLWFESIHSSLADRNDQRRSDVRGACDDTAQACLVELDPLCPCQSAGQVASTAEEAHCRGQSTVLAVVPEIEDLLPYRQMSNIELKRGLGDLSQVPVQLGN